MGKDILREIGQIYRAINSFSDYVMRSINLEKGQYQFLIRIKENPGINQKKLSLLLLVDKTTTTKAIKKLIDKGYLYKEINQQDKRNVKLYLTEKGLKTCVFLDKEEKFCTDVFLSKLNENQKKKIMEQLCLITDCSTTIYSDLSNNRQDYYINLINEIEI